MTEDKTYLGPPSYPDAVLSNPCSEPSDFLARLIQNRSSHLCKTIDDLIAPIVDSRLDRALASTIIALIPTPADISQAPSTDLDFKTVPSQIISLASDHEFDAQIQLTDAMDSIEFWMQTNVIAELEQKIKQRWQPGLPQNGSQNLPTGLADTTCAPVTTSQGDRAAEQCSVGFFPRLFSKQAKAERTNVKHLARSDSPQRVVAKVKLDEICFRAISPFGLYETVVKPAIVISINMNC